jgi:cell division protein FtsL
VAAFLLVGSLLLAVVIVQTSASQTSFRIQQLSRQTQQLEDSYGQLRLHVAQLSAPGRIVQEAGKLGYTLPTDVRTLPVRGAVPDGSTGVPDQPSFSLKGVLGTQP